MSDDLGKSVRDHLLHTQQVTAIVQAQIYPDVFDQSVQAPAIAVWVEGGQPNEDLNGTDRLGGQNVVIVAWGKDRTQSSAIAKVIRDNALPATLRGVIEGMDWKDVSLTGGASEFTDHPQDGSDRWRRAVRQTFTIWAEAI